MWVKRTPSEVAQVRRERRRHRFTSALFFGLFVLLLTLFVFGWRESADRSRLLVPFDEIWRRLPATVVYGLLTAAFYYRFGRNKPTVVCPKCGKVQYASNSKLCSCGGNFEDIEEMKWKS